MEQYSVLIADDDIQSQEILTEFVQQSDQFVPIGVAGDGEEMIEVVMNKEPDIVLVDIQMPKLNGIDAIKESIKIDPKLKFVFITGMEEFAVEAFNIDASDYIVKPVKRPRLLVALNKAKKDLQANVNHPVKERKKKLAVKFDRSYYFIPCKEILFIEKIGKKCLIYTYKRTYETYETLENLKLGLDEYFYQSHRSYIINLEHVSHIKPQNESYLIYFYNFDHPAHLSKLKIDKVQSLLQELMS